MRNDLLYSELQGSLLTGLLTGDPDSIRTQRRLITSRLAQAFEDIIQGLRMKYIIEIGANSAEFSSSIKAKLPDARVIAFEANRDVFRANRIRLREEGIRYVHACVSDVSGTQTINIPVRKGRQKRTMGSILLDSQADSHVQQDVEAVRLDDYLDGRLRQSNVLWIDVEGAVRNVIAGASAVLSQCLAMYVELEARPRWPGQLLFEEAFEILAGFGLVPVIRDVQREWQFNVIFLRSDLLLNEDLRRQLGRHVEDIAAQVARET